ncbi:MAG: FAD-dependent oxidoreductase [Candidatus Hadarchaeum sp.]|uniref:FAD-dependent oxidoreductase n=1 Tax=Candidatus Hadarchaeum sp. TaxID=2883567 RepID=UPI00317BA8E5
MCTESFWGDSASVAKVYSYLTSFHIVLYNNVTMTISEIIRTPVLIKADVVVVGGGPAGLVAAIAAARNGAKTVLIERFGFLGGMATTGLPLLGFHNRLGEQLIRGIPYEIVQRVIDLGGSPGFFFCPHHGSFVPIDPNVFKYVAARMLMEVNVTTLLYTLAVRPILSDNNCVSGVVIESKTGRAAILGSVVIDATGDADLAVKAGAPYMQRDLENLQPATLMFRMANVDIDAVCAYLEKHPYELKITSWADNVWSPAYFKQAPYWILIGLQHVVSLAKSQKEYQGIQNYVILITSPHKGEVAVNMAKIRVDGTNTEDVSRASFSAMLTVFDIARFLKKYVPGFENAYIVDISPTLGIRETRMIRGDYVLTEDDVLQDRTHEDGIALCGYFIDVHEPDGGERAFKGGPTKGFTIPFRSLLPKGLNNVLVVGRSISATPLAHGSIRVMGPCMATGQAAGTAAAIAALRECSLRDLDFTDLRKNLTEQGVYLRDA